MSGNSQYPYSEWTDGREHTACWAIHYTIPTKNFIRYMYTYARKHWLTFVVINVDYDGDVTKVTFRFERQFQDA